MNERIDFNGVDILSMLLEFIVFNHIYINEFNHADHLAERMKYLV